MKKSILIAALIAILAAAWVASGMLAPQPMKDQAEQEPPAAARVSAAPIQVRVALSSASDFTPSVTVTGKTAAARNVDIRAEVEGQIVALLADKGSKVEEGEIIARIDTRDRAARVAEAKQLVNQRDIEHRAARSLEKEGFYSRTRLAQAAADLESARAALKLAEINLAKTDIRAPFAGIIAERMVDAGDYIVAGDRLFTVVNLDPLKLSGFVSERVVMNLEPGTPAQGHLLSGEAVEGALSFVSPTADPTTRTFPVEVTLPNPDGRIVEGLTATIRIPAVTRSAHRMSPAVLTLNSDGQVGVKIVDDDDRVEFVPVVVLSDAPDHVWVAGLPETARLIVVGQDFVAPGQQVDPVLQAPAEGG